MDMNLEPGWRKALADELSQVYFAELMKTIKTASQSGLVYPSEAQMFNAFALCPFSQVKVVILGQDPYHGASQAHGLSFSVPDGTKIPPSLRNIYKELLSDVGITKEASGNLENWATQGVLLLNATLTVLPGEPGSHQGIGWEIFTDAVIKTLSEQREHVVFILWGKYAQAKKPLIDQTNHLVIASPHPSPFSAHTGFLGSKPFSQTNEYLKLTKQKEINW